MIYVTGSTKGGVGKSTSAYYLLATLLNMRNKGAEPVSIYELDNNNTTSNYFVNDATIDARSIPLSNVESSQAFIDIELQQYKNKDVIIDAGGGDDTKKVIEQLHKNDMMDYAVFIVPTLNEPSENTLHTIELILKKDKNAKIVILMSQSMSKTMKEAEKEFIFLFGSKEIGESGILTKIPSGIKSLSISFSPLMRVALGIAQQKKSGFYEIVKDYYELSKEEKRQKGGEILEKEGEKALRDMLMASQKANIILDSINDHKHFFDTIESLKGK